MAKYGDLRTGKSDVPMSVLFDNALRKRAPPIPTYIALFVHQQCNAMSNQQPTKKR